MTSRSDPKQEFYMSNAKNPQPNITPVFMQPQILLNLGKSIFTFLHTTFIVHCIITEAGNG